MEGGLSVVQSVKTNTGRQDRGPFSGYIGLLAAILAFVLLLPFTMTINDFLTSAAVQTGTYTFIETYAAPYAARMVAAILRIIFGISASTSGIWLSATVPDQSFIASIVWNCVGWQSLILYGLTLVVGLKGPFTKLSKAVCMIVGFEGTILVNLFRMAAVIALAIRWSPRIGLAFHEYAGTLILLLWLTSYWLVSYRLILQPTGQAPA